MGSLDIHGILVFCTPNLFESWKNMDMGKTLKGFSKNILEGKILRN